MFDAARDRPQILADIMAMKNWEVRQAARNFGIDMTAMRVGSRQTPGLQISRQALLDEMIRRGAKPEEIPGLVRGGNVQLPYTKPLPIPKRVAGKGLSTFIILHHELGHAIVTIMHGFRVNGVASHLNPEILQGAVASNFMDGRTLIDPATGKFIPSAVIPRLNDLLEMFAAGVAVNEMIDEIPRATNPGMGGDVTTAARVMEAAGVDVKDMGAMWDAAIDRVQAKLRHATEIIRDEASRREDNLGVEWHFSEPRLENIVNRVRSEGYAGAQAELAGQQRLPGLGFAAGTRQARSGLAPIRYAAGTRTGPTSYVPPAAGKVRPFKAAPVVFNLLLDLGHLGIMPAQVVAEGYADLHAKLVQKYGPNLRQAKIMGEGRRPLGPPWQGQLEWSERGEEQRQRERVRGSAVPLMRQTLPPEMRMEGPSTLDAAKMLNSRTRSEIGALKLGKAAPEEMTGRAVDMLREEAGYALQQANSGREWYKADVAEHDRILQEELRPELKNPTKLSLFKFAEAILSPAHDPYTNFKPTLKAWDFYRENGVFNPVQPGARRIMSWGGLSKAAYGNAFRNLNRLIDEHGGGAAGERGAVEWLLSEHPTSELRQYNPKVPGKADEMQMGAMILGDKRGPFALNLHGMEAAFTADRWVSRTWNRWMGTLEWNEEGKLADKIRGKTERALMKQSFERGAELLGLTTSELQAIMWYFEQRLYTRLGVASESGNFAAAARRVATEEATRLSARPTSSPPRSYARIPSGLARSPSGIVSPKAFSRP